MTTMTRTDIHRPSSSDFDPEAYEVFGFADFHDTEGYRPVQVVSALVSEGWSFSGAPHGSGQCSHCGARLRYAALLGHTATKTLLYVGETCLDNRFSLTAPEFARMRAEAAAKAEASRRLGKSHQFYAENPDLVFMTYARNIAAVGGVQEWTLGWGSEETFATEAEAQAAFEALPAFQQHPAYGMTPMYGYKRGTTWEEKTRMGDKISTLSDMAHKVERYGDMSDAAVAYARKILTWVTEADERLAAREAEQVAKAERGAAVTAGRQVIEGQVTTTKVVDSQFGSTLKMRVVNGDLAYWGTVPSSIDVTKGDRVRFTATVEPSSDDPSFGFFKRPAKAEVL